MPRLPLEPKYKVYRGSKENLRRKHTEQYKIACRIAEHVNTLIANDPSELQQHLFGTIAARLGVTVEEVRAAISDGGYNGITLRVTEDDRLALARYKK